MRGSPDWGSPLAGQLPWAQLKPSPGHLSPLSSTSQAVGITWLWRRRVANSRLWSILLCSSHPAGFAPYSVHSENTPRWAGGPEIHTLGPVCSWLPKIQFRPHLLLLRRHGGHLSGSPCLQELGGLSYTLTRIFCPESAEPSLSGIWGLFS